MTSRDVALRLNLDPWRPEDLVVLESANTAEMTRFLGGPEDARDLAARHAEYLGFAENDSGAMFRILADGEPVGYAGWWREEHDGEPAYEIGCAVMPEWQGRGVATEALRRVVRLAAARGDAPVVGYANAENEASNSLCRRLGFELRGAGLFPSDDGGTTVNVWMLDVSPLDLTGRHPDFEEHFDEGVLDETTWWPYYTPHWSSRQLTAARYSVGGPGLELRIDPDTPPWAPELDGEIRVSHLQTGQRSGPLGSDVGQHRFRPGLIVREEQPERRLLLPHFGVIEARLAAIGHPSAMVALWPIGFEDEPHDCGEICIAEIFGSEVGEDHGWVGVGVKPQNDPRLTEDFEKIRVAGDLTQPHDYAVEWTRDELRFFIDHRWVKTVRQTIDYPVQLMLDVYEFPPEEGERDAAALPHRFRVTSLRTYPPVG